MAAAAKQAAEAAEQKVRAPVVLESDGAVCCSLEGDFAVVAAASAACIASEHMGWDMCVTNDMMSEVGKGQAGRGGERERE